MINGAAVAAVHFGGSLWVPTNETLSTHQSLFHFICDFVCARWVAWVCVSALPCHSSLSIRIICWHFVHGNRCCCPLRACGVCCVLLLSYRSFDMVTLDVYSLLHYEFISHLCFTAFIIVFSSPFLSSPSLSFTRYTALNPLALFSSIHACTLKIPRKKNNSSRNEFVFQNICQHLMRWCDIFALTAECRPHSVWLLVRVR